jgi:hypothetical protein
MSNQQQQQQQQQGTNKKVTWRQHLADFRRNNPHIAASQVMTLASQTYKNNQDIDSKKHLIDFLKEYVIGEQIVEKYCIPNTKIELEAKKICIELNEVKVEDLDSLKEILCNHMDYGLFSSKKGIGYLMSILEDDDFSLIKKFLYAYHLDGGLKYKQLVYE